MYIYKTERESGLADALKSLSFVIARQVEAISRNDLPSSRLPGSPPPYAKASVGDSDLFWFKSILVSSGWNDNDHYFEPLELWQARHTPEDKPINVDHVQHDIVGHMIGSYVVGADKSTVIPDETAPEEIPPSFHLVTPGVLYRAWESDGLQKRSDELVAEIVGGTRAVSMECWFKSFDYLLEDEQGNQKIVARTKETACLTKLLRFFGGAGQLDGKRLGMVLRGLTFAGKGLVTNPANPNSQIVETELAAAVGYPNHNEVKDPIMASETVNHEAKLAEKDAVIVTLQSQLAEATAQISTMTTQHKTLAEELATVKASLVKAGRLEAVLAALNLSRDGDGQQKAEAFLAPILGLSDESFAAVLKNQQEIVAAIQAANKPVVVETTETKTAASILEKVKTEETPSLSVAATETNYDEALKAVAERYKNLSGSTKN